jgi:endonuclease/exonuclease/phosphatase (EEP) superfamily protein YafD
VGCRPWDVYLSTASGSSRHSLQPALPATSPFDCTGFPEPRPNCLLELGRRAIPSILTKVRLRSGALVSVYGVHPGPPAIQQNSTERDVELLRAGFEIKALKKPAIVLGDLNDVAWSPTTLNLMRAGDFWDP